MPHLWPGYAGYKSKKVAKRRSLTTSSEGRAQKEKASLQAKIDEERQKDSVSSLSEILEKLEELLPDDVQRLCHSNKLILYKIITEPVPTVKYSLTIHNDLVIELVHGNEILPAKQFKHIVGPKISYASEIPKLLSFLADRSTTPTPENIISAACKNLEYCIDTSEHFSTTSAGTIPNRY